MTKRKPEPRPIDHHDLSLFLEQDSSFAFEMQIRELFAGRRKIRHHHGGTYDDPIEGKPRQFDLTADLIFPNAYFPLRVRMAIECKCLSEFAPMLVYRSPRTSQECSHHLIARTCGDRKRIQKWVQENAKVPQLSCDNGSFPEACVINIPPGQSMYRRSGPVGKSVECVNRDCNGKLHGGDREIYPRWTQSLQSAAVLASDTITRYHGDREVIVHWILPILVVPDDRLFAVDFDDAGSIVAPPHPVDQTTFFVDYRPKLTGLTGPEFRLGHLEVMSRSSIERFLDCLLCDDHRLTIEELVPVHAVLGGLTRY